MSKYRIIITFKDGFQKVENFDSFDSAKEIYKFYVDCVIVSVVSSVKSLVLRNYHDVIFSFIQPLKSKKHERI